MLNFAFPALPAYDPLSFIAFLFAATLLAITPGPGLAYVVARTAAGGRAEGLASCVGTALGGMAHVAAAALGLSALLAESARAFAAVKLIGALYLVYLGVRILTQRTAVFDPAALDLTKVKDAPQGSRRALVEGVFVEVLNVKTALFFVAFLPQFVHADAPVAAQLAWLGTLCVLLNTSVDAIAVFAADRLLNTGGAQAARAGGLRWISGLTLIGLGGALAFAQRE